MTEEELQKYMRFTDKEVIIDKQFYKNTILKCMNNASYRIDKAIKMLEINIEIAKQQPSKNELDDIFILNIFNVLLSILKGDIDE